MAIPEWADRVHPSWRDLLESHAIDLFAIDSTLAAEREAGFEIAPPAHRILRALEVPVDSIRVLILGQDPYPTPGHAVGWSFSTERSVRPLPRSLANIYAELHDDLGVPVAEHGDLGEWVDQGVMLLNATLTVRVGDAGSHRHLPWRTITAAIVTRLAESDVPLVAVLWGNDAQWVKPLLGATPVIESAHPSPLSARRGFFGSRPFSRANAMLVEQGAQPIEWTIASS